MMRRRTSTTSWLLLALLLIAPLPAQAGGLIFLESQPFDKTLIDSEGTLGALAVAVNHDDESLVYVAGKKGLSLWKRDLGTGRLTFQQAALDNTAGVDGLEGGSAIALAPGSLGVTHVYVAGNGDHAVAVFSSAAGTGALTFIEQKIADGGIGNPPTDEMKAPTDIAVSSDGAHVYVTAEGSQTLVVFSRNAVTGQLTYLTAYASTNDVPPFEGLNHPHGITLDPDGKFVYVAAHRDISGGASDGTVVVLRRDDVPGPTFGQLTYLQMLRDNQGTPPVQRLNDPQALVVSPDRKHLYVASFGANALVVFTRDDVSASPTFGQLTFLESQFDGGLVLGLGNAYGVAIDPDGKYVYATGRNERALNVFARDTDALSPTFGKLSYIESQISPENKDAPKYPFTCNGGTNNHANCNYPSECPGGSCSGDVIHGLVGAGLLAVAPNGKNIYAAAGFPGTVLTFGIDTCGNGKRGTDEECDDLRPLCVSCQLNLCPTTPGTGCGTIHTTTTGDAQLSIKNDPLKSDGKDSLQWQWKKGNVAAPAFGDPITTADYAICVYDSSANPQPLARRAAPQGKGWTKKLDSMTSTVKQFDYKNKGLRPDGIEQIKLKVGSPNKAEVTFKGKSYFLKPPALAPLVPGPPGLTMPVTVEVRNTQNTDCWVATYDGIVGVLPKRISKNNETQFKGKNN